MERICKHRDTNSGTEFKTNSQYNAPDDLHDDRQFKHNESGCSTKTTELDIPFNKLKFLMAPVTENGSVKKQVLKNGTGHKIPQKAIIIMHYDMFLNNQRIPFVSTRFRHHPHQFSIGDGSIIPSLEVGIQTMEKYEIARILISPGHASENTGCRPKTPGNAEILYVVEIMDFFEEKDSVKEVVTKKHNKISFENVLDRIHYKHQKANALFRKERYKPAITQYVKIVRLLQNVSVSNEQEHEQRNHYLVKVYLNLCLCNINIMNSKQAIMYGKLGLELDSQNHKAMYRLGCAFMLADEFHRAKDYLLEAREHMPFEPSIQEVLVVLQKKFKEHQKWENVICKKTIEYHILKNETLKYRNF